MRKLALADNPICHIYNRGVEKRNTFIDKDDYLRFIGDMYQFNDSNPTINYGRNFNSFGEFPNQRNRNKLVEILAFCLMPNHYHILMHQLVDKGITEFMRKLGTGYTNYFNIKYDRVGPLFQGKFKTVFLKKESHFLYLPHYIHLNPLDLVMPSWRNGKIDNTNKAINFLEKYRWSSLPDYLGKENFPLVFSKKLVMDLAGGQESFVKNFKEYISDNLNIESISDVIIEN